MPTLIRLIITLLFLVGLAYGGMIALVSFVQPSPKEVTIRIPAHELLPQNAPDFPFLANEVAVGAATDKTAP